MKLPEEAVVTGEPETAVVVLHGVMVIWSSL